MSNPAALEKAQRDLDRALIRLARLEMELREHDTSERSCWCHSATEPAVARQAREGERLRVTVRQLIDNASAGLIHYSGESCDVVRVSDLQHATGERCDRCCDDCQSCPCIEDRGL